jgi:hypothetical protein
MNIRAPSIAQKSYAPEIENASPPPLAVCGRKTSSDQIAAVVERSLHFWKQAWRRGRHA